MSIASSFEIGNARLEHPQDLNEAAANDHEEEEEDESLPDGRLVCVLPCLPYGDVPPLLDILLELLVSESHRSWRRLFIRTVGFRNRKWGGMAVGSCDNG